MNDLLEVRMSPRYVDGPKLLEIIFDDDCRPSLRWLREQQAMRKLPFVKIGRLIFFDPVAVKAALDAQAILRMNGRKFAKFPV